MRRGGVSACPLLGSVLRLADPLGAAFWGEQTPPAPCEAAACGRTDQLGREKFLLRVVLGAGRCFLLFLSSGGSRRLLARHRSHGGIEQVYSKPRSGRAGSMQAKPIYGGWLLLAPEGTDFDNPVHRSRKWQRRFFILYEHGLLRYALDEMVSAAPQIRDIAGGGGAPDIPTPSARGGAASWEALPCCSGTRGDPCRDGERILSLQPHPSTILPAGRCHFVLCKGSALLVKHPMGSALLLAAGEQLSTVMLG
ncbi:Myosin phosphatase Rho-interacting protein [Anas platyrhynchos]|uniref:Myosin phosphatase Rho-interacting protein n=1 Tax=Anas platyrhynchos TaxID=8839 RepID=R0LM20_ANAPL|nr:Myosin phosphatase Rho-interacting protein [Anas platyrhynchos]